MLQDSHKLTYVMSKLTISLLFKVRYIDCIVFYLNLLGKAPFYLKLLGKATLDHKNVG